MPLRKKFRSSAYWSRYRRYQAARTIQRSYRRYRRRRTITVIARNPYITDWWKDKVFWAYLNRNRADYDYFNRPLRSRFREKDRIYRLRFRQKREYMYWRKHGVLPRPVRTNY